MRVLHGRLKAVLVATLATIILIGILAPATTLAGDPPGLARFMAAVGRIESGGSYTARNSRSGAYGKYQIMPSSWRGWARLYLGDANARPTPANQEIVATAKFRSLYRWLDSWRRVAYWWLTGSDRTYGWSSFATSYVNRVMAYYAAARDSAPPPPAAPTPAPTPEVAPAPDAAQAPDAAAAPAVAAAPAAVRHRFQESNAAITYSGTWRLASGSGYAGRAVRYAKEAGASASFTFTGRKITWSGPTGPTRGQARIYVDGAFVRRVDLYRSSFRARNTLFNRTWADPGEHTIRIEVVGTKGHPMVAIDEFVVTE